MPLIHSLRRGLNRLFAAGGAVAAVFIGLIAALIIVQVLGRELGFQVPGADDFTAWSVAASVFFALAYTFKEGGHIRVTLVTSRLRGRSAKAAAFIALLISTAAVGFLTLSAAHFLYDNYRFGDVAQGLVSVPMWIPPLSLFLGAFLFFLAILDSFLAVLCGGERAGEKTE